MSTAKTCRYPACTENVDDRCPDWLTGACTGPAAPAPVARAGEFEAWYDTVVKYVEPADIAAWMHDAWDAGRASTPAPVAQPLTADDLKEPKNGAAWRVVWWNESARLMLPAASTLYSFQTYKTGTMVFTIMRIDIEAMGQEGGA